MGHRLAILTIAAFLALPGLASAEIRSGQATDRTGDSTGPAYTDITRATASYDTNGSLIVSVYTATPITAADDVFAFFQTGSYSGSPTLPFCSGVTATQAGFSKEPTGILTISGYNGIGDAFASLLFGSFGFGSNAPALANKDWTCMTVSTSLRNQTSVGDRLDVPVFFKGYGPDSDDDGLVDNVDNCPTAPAPGTATGCPAPTPPAPVAPVVPVVATPAPVPTFSAGNQTTPPVTVTKPSSPTTASKLPASEVKYRARLKACEKLSSKRSRTTCVTRAKQIKALTACSKIKGSRSRAACQRAAKRRYKL